MPKTSSPVRPSAAASTRKFSVWILSAICAAILFVSLASKPAGGQAPAQSASAQSAAGFLTPPASPDARALSIDRGAAGVWQSLHKLQTRASVLMVVAHPDDEDSGMLTYEPRGRGTRAMMLTLNRGEGGQNVMSDDFEDALGLVRTQELLSADRYSDVQQYFGTEVDFGFSKTREESLEKWG